MKIVSLIPARKGSKRIEKKNLQHINGIPLICYSIGASILSQVNETWVSTNDEEVKEIASSNGVSVLDRPDELARDESTTEDVIAHFLKEVECDALVLIQPTSPMIVGPDIDKGIDEFVRGGYDSLFSACVPEDMLIWNAFSMSAINYSPTSRMKKEERVPILIETGGFYIFKKELFVKERCRLGGKIGYSIVPFWRSFEVDTKEDLENVRQLMYNDEWSDEY